MTEKPESGETHVPRKDPENDDSFKAQTPQTGKFLKVVDEETDVDAEEVEDGSEGMTKPDFLGKSNRENREE